MKFKPVTKEEYYDVIKAYPSKLVWNVAAMYEPPLGTHNDFSNGNKWPESVVAKVQLYNGSDYHGGKHCEYYVRAYLCP